MITFKTYLTEARMAPLYHGTSTNGLNNIVHKKQGIKPLTHQYIMSKNKFAQSGVSLSRNMHFAINYGGGVVLELDQQRLAQNYKIVPFNFFKNVTRKQNPFFNEYEEFVLTDKPIPLKYITSIYVVKYLFKNEVVDKIRQEYGSTFIKAYHYRGD